MGGDLQVQLDISYDQPLGMPTNQKLSAGGH